jgi:hypothetical protein
MVPVPQQSFARNQMPAVPSPTPEPLTVHYSPWKVGVMALFIAHLSAWWTWRGIEALMTASPKTFHLWLSPALGAVLTLALLGGVVALFKGKTSVVVVDDTGVIASDLYEDRIPWRAIGGITKVRGRGVVFEVADGASYGRKMTRNVRAGSRQSASDMACIRSGLLDQPTSAILASMQAHQEAQRAGRGKRSETT